MRPLHSEVKSDLFNLGLIMLEICL